MYQLHKTLAELIAEGDCDLRCGNASNCCASCGRNNGHFSEIDQGRFTEQENAEIADIRKKHWTPEKGYLTDTGCSLPRRLRSFKCLSWRCY